ncbi:MAG TPA: DUF547 domain-containing protein [Terriglobia bacterium]|nr:DUF547 domain-containing protein [Terriglobia bacterium]
MRGVSLMLGLWLALSGWSVDVRAQQFDHSAWDHVLKQFVTDQGRVDYAALQANPVELDRYVTELAAASPISDPPQFPTREGQLVYWINAYNALVMKGVIEHWPVKSVRKIGGLPYSFFWREKFVLGGRKYTLDGVEGILRKTLAEPRIHFALVCAANSCPRLQRQAYTPENTDRLLEEDARFYVNEPRNLRIDPEQNRVTVARMFSFYHEDFENYVRGKNLTGIGQPILDYIRLYANEEHRRALDALNHPGVQHFDYDWGINDVHAPTVTGKSG